jgi:Tfp pilus assembly PilM family ATPase
MLGIDIQSDAIRIAQMKRIRRRYYLERLVEVFTTHKLIDEGKIRQWDKLTEQLVEIVQEFQLKEMSAAVAVTDAQVRIKKLTYPILIKEAALKADIELQNQTFYFDYDVVSNTEKEVKEATVVIADEEYVSRLLAAVNAAGIIVKVVDVDLFAHQRALANIKELDNLSNWKVSNFNNFLCACGLAMREVPPW